MKNTYNKNVTLLLDEVPNLYYITQYASAVTSDDQVYRSVARWVEQNNIDITLLSDLMARMPSVSDGINQKVFNILTSMSNSELMRAITLYDAILSESLGGLGVLCSGVVSDWMINNNIATPEDWEEIADADLKQNGIAASSLYWVNKINYEYEYCCLNAYENDFEGLEVNDIIIDIVTENINNLIFDTEK